jgi:preprotein translocase subunit SecD
LAASVAALIYLTPTLVKDPAKDLPSWWGSILPSDRIHLGLDLQGGSHLILEVKVDKAIENNVERARGDLTNLLRERGISGVTLERVQGTQIQLKVPAANVERVRGVLKGDFPNLEVASTQSSGGTTEFFLTLSKEEFKSLRDYAVDQSLETIRNRIDQFGVSEPIIQRQGNRIF